MTDGSDPLLAEEDQAFSDRTANAHSGDDARSCHPRAQSARDGDITAHARSETARVRDDAAAVRDRQAEERDAAARERDQRAALADAESERLELHPHAENGSRLRGADILMRAAGLRRRAAASRARSAEQREAAARDRDLAAQDRQHAAHDRTAAAAELAAEGVDHLTGVLRRRVGLAAMQRELDRTDRSAESMVIAFVDIVGLKLVNDREGHAAGDSLLRAVGQVICAHLRPYDLVARYGGDEFVCSLTGLDENATRIRFEQITGRIPGRSDRQAITVGLAKRHDGEPLEDVIHRADVAMLEARRATSA